ncbi:Hypothetical predicted protein [Cloeon dipterum]|uniref:C2H2-type domain-containing protein n=1 Tax=Cloeon dipterum TaxID=197152 RepID=A0A8S1DR79_9INSE|nr:Hypothetical predicted protein [Cloeon dipterum]
MRSISKFAKLEEKVDRELKLHPPQYPIPDDHKEASAWDNKDECCSVCKLYIGDVESMHEHIRKEHADRLTCNTCKEVQSTVESLKKHIINHKNDYFEKKAKFVPAVMVKLPTGIVVRRQRCTTCNQFVSNLKRHIIVKHTKDYRFGCTECGKKFPLEVDLAKHIKIYHQKEFPYLCIECGKGFFSKTLLSAHERRHRGEKFAFCDTCGDGFYSKQLLVTHIQSRHFITSRDHPCEICGKRYKSQTALRLHRKLHFDEFMKFVCNFCGRRFYKMCLLNYHVKRVHTLERPFQCDTCGMGFILRSRMATHAISHMDVKMNQCKFCPNSYRWAHTLNRHMKKAHRDQLAAWMCDLCGEELHSEVSLMNHKAKKHPIPHQFLIAPEEFRKVGGQAETNSSEVFF